MLSNRQDIKSSKRLSLAVDPARKSPHVLYRECGLSIEDYVESLHAYFDFPGLHCQFIPEESFWEDFREERCSPALLFAIACRGIPYTSAEKKWDKQQRLAVSCLKGLPKADINEAPTNTMRVDDLEAMALMLEFEYETLNTASLPSSGHFMTHDALILRALQSRNRILARFDPSAALAHADERFELLYWHVYVLDSFRCLRCLRYQSMSLIPDDSVLCLANVLLEREVETYPDAMLTLGIIVRQIANIFLQARMTTKGINLADVSRIYEKLAHWRNHILPSSLRSPVEREVESPAQTRFIRGSTPIPASRQNAVYRAVLWALEISCYLQVEQLISCVGWKEND